MEVDLMLKIYPKGTTSFNEEGYGYLVDFIEDPKVTENNVGYFALEMKYARGGRNAEYLVEDNLIRAKPSSEQKELTFVIYDIEEDFIENALYVRAEVQIYHEAKARKIAERITEGATAFIAFKDAVHEIDEPFPYRITGNSRYSFYLEHKEISLFSLLFGEGGMTTTAKVTPRVFDGGIMIMDNRGRQNVAELHDTDFVKDFKIERSKEGMVTKIIPFTDARKDYLTDEDYGERKKRETSENKVYGNAVFSPNVQAKGYPILTEYIEYRNEETGKYNVNGGGKEDNTIEMTTYRYESVDDLNREAATFFIKNEGVDEYKITYTIDFVATYRNKYNRLTSLELYDTADFYYNNDKQHLKLTVTSVTYNVLTDTVEKMEFSAKAMDVSTAQSLINQKRENSESLREMIKKRNDELHLRNLINFNINSLGQKISYEDELPDPSTAKEGDVAFISNGKGGTDIWIFKDGAWVYIPAANNEEYVKQAIADMEKKAEEITKKANEASAKTDSIAGEVLGTKTLAEEAKGIADEAKKLASGVGDKIQSIKDKQEEDNQATLNILGQDGYLKYSNNRIDGAVDRKLVPDHNATVIKHNGKGFVVGKPYTLSFCVKVEKAPILPFAVGIQSHIERSM